MNIRPTQHSDLSQLSFIWYERIALLQQSDSYFTPLPDAMQVWQEQAALWINDEQRCFLAAEHNDRLIGYICVLIVDGPIGLQPRQLGNIVDIGVDLHQSHRNLGGQLVDEAKAWLNDRNIRILTIDLPARYPVEEAFWRSIGAKLRFNEFWIMI